MVINSTKYDIEQLFLPEWNIVRKEADKRVPALNNGNILYVYPAFSGDLQTESGIQVPKSLKEEVAKIIQREGGMLVNWCPSLEELPSFRHTAQSGKYVKIAADTHTILHGFHFKIDDKPYEAIVLPAYTVVCEVVKPTYNTDIKVNTKKGKSNLSNTVV